MSENIHIVAGRLYQLIRAPAGAVGVLAWPVGPKPRLRVFVAEGYSIGEFVIPERYLGYHVEIGCLKDVVPFRAEIEGTDLLNTAVVPCERHSYRNAPTQREENSRRFPTRIAKSAPKGNVHFPRAVSYSLYSDRI